jgi:hypothetical protein
MVVVSTTHKIYNTRRPVEILDYNGRLGQIWMFRIVPDLCTLLGKTWNKMATCASY